MVDYLRSRAVADRQIKKWGHTAKLRRTSGDRICYALEVQLSASEKRQLKNLTSRVFIVSAVDLDVAPSKEDSLVTYAADGTTENPPLRQVAPVAPLAPGGIVIYYELQVE